jgi:hypothetical protein
VSFIDFSLRPDLAVGLFLKLLIRGGRETECVSTDSLAPSKLISLRFRLMARATAAKVINARRSGLFPGDPAYRGLFTVLK